MTKYIFDSHVHIFPEKIAAKAAVNIGKFYDLHMDYDGSVNKLLEVWGKHGVSKYLVQSVATVPQQVSHINDFIAEQVSLHSSEFIGFASLHPDMEGVEQEVERAVSLGLKGIKLHPDFQQFAINDKRAYKIYEVIEGRLPVLVHMGDSRYHYSNPHLMADVSRDFPKLRIMAAHFGGYSEWEEAENCLAGLDNIWVDTCSSLAFMTPERACELINEFGEDRVFFGTDYPMWDIGFEIDNINKLPITQELKEKIMWKNLNDFLGLGIE